MLSNVENQDDESQKRLVNILRTVMFRRTHASRLFTLPVIKFPDIEERIVTTEFYPVEREIYDAIVDVFFKNINGKRAHRFSTFRFQHLSFESTTNQKVQV